MRPGNFLRTVVVICCVFSLLPLVTVVWIGFTGEGFVRFPPQSYSLMRYADAPSGDCSGQPSATAHS